MVQNISFPIPVELEGSSVQRRMLLSFSHLYIGQSLERVVVHGRHQWKTWQIYINQNPANLRALFCSRNWNYCIFIFSFKKLFNPWPKLLKKIEIRCFTVPSATVHSQLATRVPHLGLCSPVGPWAFMLKNPEPWLLSNTHPGGPKAPKLPNFPGATISHHPTGETIKRLICLFWRPVYTAFFFF